MANVKGNFSSGKRKINCDKVSSNKSDFIVVCYILSFSD